METVGNRAIVRYRLSGSVSVCQSSDVEFRSNRLIPGALPPRSRDTRRDPQFSKATPRVSAFLYSTGVGQVPCHSYARWVVNGKGSTPCRGSIILGLAGRPRSIPKAGPQLSATSDSRLALSLVQPLPIELVHVVACQFCRRPGCSVRDMAVDLGDVDGRVSYSIGDCSDRCPGHQSMGD